jgi:hypothetical protein
VNVSFDLIQDLFGRRKLRTSVADQVDISPGVFLKKMYGIRMRNALKKEREATGNCLPGSFLHTRYQLLSVEQKF